MTIGKGLGKGLDALVPPKLFRPAKFGSQQLGQVSGGGDQFLQIPIETIRVNPYQPRQHFDHAAIEDLINSIREHGILQPLIVTQDGKGYQLIAGERRLRAARILGLKTVPAIVRIATEPDKLAISLIENIQRTDLNPIERARAYKKLGDEFGYTHEEIGRAIGKSGSAVSHALQLLNLSPDIQQAIAAGQITEQQAYEMLKIELPRLRRKVFKKIIRERLGTMETTVEVAKIRQNIPLHLRRTPVNYTDASLLDKEAQLRSYFNTKVLIKKKGRIGQINIEFYSDEELQEILRKILK